MTTDTNATGTLIMTGASRGLGREAARRLLHDRADLHLLILARGGHGTALADELAAATSNPNVSIVPCDLASLDDVRMAAATIRAMLDTETLPPLRGFLGNAAVQLASRSTSTVDGFETTFAVNVLSHFLLLRLLLDRFTAPSQIMLTTSASHFGDFAHNYGMVPKPRWEPVDRLAARRTGPAAASRAEGYTAYATSKLAVIYLVHALARRLPQGVDAYSYNPGLVPGTGIIRQSGAISRSLFHAVLPVLQLSPHIAMSPRSAGTRLAAILSTTNPGPSGSYIDRGTVKSSAPASYDEDREESLWRTASTLCRLP